MAISFPRRWLVLTLAAVIAGTTSLADATQSIRAQAPASPSPTVSLELPTDADFAQDRAIVPDGVGPNVIPDIDLGKIQGAAVDIAASLPEDQWDVAALGWAMDGDPLAAFRFVRDHIRLEPYAGVLRGPDGTLAARAGNSVDRALLLKTLLDAMQVRSRFAVGDLDDATVDELLDQAMRPAPVPPPDTTSADIGDMDSPRIRTRARHDYALLQESVGDQLAAASGSDQEAARDDLRQHMWLQVWYGTDWLDYDTTLPDAQPGQRLTTVTTALDDLPASESQTITVRVVTESITGDRLVQTTSLERDFEAWDAATSEVFLYFQPTISTIGGSILQALGEAVYWEPELMVDKVVQRGTQFQVQSGSDIFDPEATPDPLLDSPLAGVRLVVERHVPGRLDETFEHVILDRVPAAARATGNVTVGQLVPMAADAAGPVALAPIIHLMVSTGGTNPRNDAISQAVAARFVGQLVDPETAGDFELGDLLWPMAVADQSLVTASERLIVPAVAAGSLGHAYVGDARVYLTRIGPAPSGDGSMQVATDLLIDGVRIIGAQGQPTDAASRRMWYGTLQTALETQFVYEIARGFESDGRTLIGVSDADRAPLTVLRPDDPASVPAGAAPALKAAVSTGLIALVPGDVATSETWWTVDPSDGATRSIIDPGYGSFIGGGNYVDSKLPGDAHYVDDQGNSLVRKARGPAPRCRGGQEYVTLIGCVSTPLAWIIRGTVGVGVVIAVYYANKAWQGWIGQG
jgi:hypothetical protein